MNVTITQQGGFFTLWIGNYPYMIFTCAERAKKRLEEVKQILAN